MLEPLLPQSVDWGYSSLAAPPPLDKVWGTTHFTMVNFSVFDGECVQ